MKFLTLFVVFVATAVTAQLESPYTYVCENEKCLRRLKSKVAPGEGMPMDVCKLTCASFATLWPKPTGDVRLGSTLFSFPPGNVVLENLRDNPEPIQDMLSGAFEIFNGYLTKVAGSEPKRIDGPQLSVNLMVEGDQTEITWNTIEGYLLNISADGEIATANITAANFFGARHALETLSQLIAYNEDTMELQVLDTVFISDMPVYRHRGVHLDTARNFIPVDKIKKVIDGMSYSKLNMFHWHIVDSQSFPMEVPSRPKMHQYGAYRSSQVYSTENILDVVQYGRQRGVKVIPELDQPAHSGYGYIWGEEDGLGRLVVCVEDDPWTDSCVQPNCGQMNLVNDNATAVIGDIVNDMMTMFDHDAFHYGGDEINFNCYNKTPEITDWMEGNGYGRDLNGFLRLWAEWQEKVTRKLVEASGQNTQVILWTSDLTEPSIIEQYLDKERYIIQIWSESTDEGINDLLEKGYRVIFSNVDALYLDCGWPAWMAGARGHNWCSPMKGWQTVYDNDPEAIYARRVGPEAAAEAVRSGQILGGETALWGEQLDGNSVESRMFPRVTAHAERMWTNPKEGFDAAWDRILNMRYKLVERGINADQLTEDYCHQYEGKCHV